MAKRSPLVLPCLTAVGLLAACATPPAVSPEESTARLDLAALPQPAPKHRRPAVPPLEGPDSPLLQLGLVKPVPRPQGPHMHAQAQDQSPTGQTLAQADTADESDEVAARQPPVAEIEPVRFALQSQNVELPIQIAAAAVELEGGAPVIEIGDILFAAQSEGVALPFEIASAKVELPAEDRFEIAESLFTARIEPIELAMRYDIPVTLPPAPAELTVAELEPGTPIATGAPLVITPVTTLELEDVGQAPTAELAAAPPAPRPREEKLAATIRARAQAQEEQAEGGPELPFKLRR